MLGVGGGGGDGRSGGDDGGSRRSSSGSRDVTYGVRVYTRRRMRVRARPHIRVGYNDDGITIMVLY